MRFEKLPDEFRAVEVTADSADERFGEILHPARPSVAATFDPIQHELGAVPALRISKLLRAATIFGTCETQPRTKFVAIAEKSAAEKKVALLFVAEVRLLPCP